MRLTVTFSGFTVNKKYLSHPNCALIHFSVEGFCRRVQHGGKLQRGFHLLSGQKFETVVLEQE